MNSKRLSELRYKGHITDSEYEELKLAIKALEDERPQGEWIPTVIDTGLFERSVCREWQCSNCGEVVKIKYPFCHCGADMRGKEAENNEP